jgi:hypothetical protein
MLTVRANQLASSMTELDLNQSPLRVDVDLHHFPSAVQSQ